MKYINTKYKMFMFVFFLGWTCRPIYYAAWSRFVSGIWSIS